MHYKDDYYRFAYVDLSSKEDALDALQDMIVIVFNNISKLKNPSAFKAWSFTILSNICKKILKQKNKVIALNEVSIDATDARHNVSEISIDISKELLKLNKQQSEAIKLKFFLDLDYDTISQITKTPVGTVKSRVFNGLKKLKELLGGAYL